MGDVRAIKDAAWSAYCKAPTHRDMGRSKVDAAVDAVLALSARAAVPEGWALVPVKPTKFMMDAAIPPGRQDQTGRREFAIWQAMLAAAPQPAGEDAQPEVWINRCPVNHDRRATCPRCESSRPPGAKHGQPVSAPPEPAPSAPAATGKEPLQVEDVEALALIVDALEQSQPFAHGYPEAQQRHADALQAARQFFVAQQAAKDGAE